MHKHRRLISNKAQLGEWDTCADNQDRDMKQNSKQEPRESIRQMKIGGGGAKYT